MAKKKYDVVIGNPPYSQNLHLDFLADGIRSLKPNGKGIFVHPGSWAISEVKGANVTNRVAQFSDHVAKITFVHSPFVGKAAMGIPVIYTEFSETPQTSIEVHDTTDVNSQPYKINSLNQMTKWGNVPIYHGIKAKIFDKLSTSKKLQDFVVCNGKAKQNSFIFCVSKLMGNYNDRGGPKPDFYAFFYKGGNYTEPFPARQLSGKEIRFFTFNTIDEATNFREFLKTYIARFCLSIAKFDRNINPITLSTTPWMNFTQSWDDKKLAAYFGFTRQELVFIADHIPAYYPDVEPLV